MGYDGSEFKRPKDKKIKAEQKREEKRKKRQQRQMEILKKHRTSLPIEEECTCGICNTSFSDTANYCFNCGADLKEKGNKANAGTIKKVSDNKNTVQGHLLQNSEGIEHVQVADPHKESIKQSEINKQSNKKLLKLIFLLLILLVAFSSVFENKKSSSSFNNTHIISADGYIGCLNKEQLKRMVSYVAVKDIGAFGKSLNIGIESGACTPLNAGEEVYVTGSKSFSGLIKIRRKGSFVEYWTNIEAIK